LSEFSLIDWIRRRAPGNDRTLVGIGDDCATLRFRPGADVLVTADMLLDGRHFRLDEVDPAQVGHKVLAVNLSDIAAMAGLPVAAFATVALPRSRATELARSIVDGMIPLAEQFGVGRAGGAPTAWEGPLAVSVTLLGEAAGRGPVGRSGARPGDAICITGPLGGSLLGRHLRPEPRIEAALAMNRAVALHAMIDISDGLASDLQHILDESGGLGATLDAELIMIHADAYAAARLDGRTPLDHALNDGEDFELCFTLEPDDLKHLRIAPAFAPEVRRIGTIEVEPGLRLRTPDDLVAPLSPRGFDHLAAGP